MKIHSLIVAGLVLLVLVGTLYWSEHRKPVQETAKGPTDAAPAILKLEEGAIAKLELKKRDAEPIVLTKSDSGAWEIAHPEQLKADQNTVAGVVSALSHLTSERLIDEKASDVKQYGLDPPALEVDITEKSNKTERLLIGDETPTGGAAYAMLAGDTRVFTMASYEKTSLDKSVKDLRAKDLEPAGTPGK